MKKDELTNKPAWLRKPSAPNGHIIGEMTRRRPPDQKKKKFSLRLIRSFDIAEFDEHEDVEVWDEEHLFDLIYKMKEEGRAIYVTYKRTE